MIVLPIPYLWLDFSWQNLGWVSLMMMCATTLSSVLLYKSSALVILISEGEISGPSQNFFSHRETLSISNLDKSSFYKRSFYEAVSGVYSLQSRDRRKIIFAHSVYEKSDVDKIYKILKQE